MTNDDENFEFDLNEDDIVDLNEDEENDEATEDGEGDSFISDMIPIRGIVALPNNIMPLTVGRACSVSVIEKMFQNNKSSSTIVLLVQKDEKVDFPKPDFNDFYQVGVEVRIDIENIVRLPHNILKVMIDVKRRVKIHKISLDPISADSEVKIYKVVASKLDDHLDDRWLKGYGRSIIKNLLASMKRYIDLNDKISKDIYTHLLNVRNKQALPDIIMANIHSNCIKVEEKQELLECINLYDRAEKVCAFIEESIEVLNTESKIKDRIKSQMDSTHTRYYLLEQLKAVQKELEEHDSSSGGGGGEFNEIAELEKRINSINFTESAKEKALEELRKLKMMNHVSAEATVVRSYLDWLCGLPWGNVLQNKMSLNKAISILDVNHYGMSDVKDRVLEYLAVQQKVGRVSGSILCLLGPPGVGKTSLVKSIADAMGRPFVKVALGGVRDESEIRGHRRTYIGSMPGKIIQGMKKAKYSNPLMLLDEIDKMGSDFRGDPASSLLEVLDTEQNSQFVDHYLEVEYDLSNVVFVATSNTTEIPYALLDRLEIIRVSGYTEEEKINIAKNYLLKKIRKDHDFTPSEFNLSKSVLLEVVRSYTRESGVRGLKREMEKLARKSVHNILSEKISKPSITLGNISNYLGVKKFVFGEISEENSVGVVTGLAYTEVGGELLKIEAVALPGKGNIKSTGKLGEVMQESVQAAYSFIISRCWKYAIHPSYYGKHDVHVHVPAGATPKDGPSAGIAMTTAIVSVMTAIPIKRDIAMTGEVTLSGRVLPIGGLKEKLLAALRGGVKKVLIPLKNKKDLAEMPSNVLDQLEIVFVDTVDKVLKHALVTMPRPIKITDDEYSGSSNSSSSGDDSFINADNNGQVS